MTSCQCVLLTSSGVCLLDATAVYTAPVTTTTTTTATSFGTTPPLDSASFCRLLACLLQISHGPEGTTDTTTSTLENTNTTACRHRSMFVLENRPIYILEDTCLGIALACWTEDELPSTANRDSALPLFLHTALDTFVRVQGKDTITQEVTAANARLEDLCLNYSVETVVVDNVTTGNKSSATVATTTDATTMVAFQTFKNEWLVPALLGMMHATTGVTPVTPVTPVVMVVAGGRSKDPSLVGGSKKEPVFQAVPPSTTKPLGSTRPMMNNLQTAVVDGGGGSASASASGSGGSVANAVGSGAAAAAVLSK
jgi:hypothetical protein